MNIIWLEKDDLIPNIIGRLRNADIILDIGCGIMPQTYITPKVHICCEPYTKYLNVLQERIREETDKDYILLKLTWEDVTKIMPPKSVDTIFLLDVIEHVEKERGLQLLRETEKIARQQIVIFTPLGFMPQEHFDGKDGWNLNGGAWQEHKSGWLPEDFDDTWMIYACKDYHEHDNKGNLLDKPFGAFWAIKEATKQDENETNSSQGVPKSLWLNFQNLEQDHQDLLQLYQKVQQEYQNVQQDHLDLLQVHQNVQQDHQDLLQVHQNLQQHILVRLARKFRLLRR